MPIAMRKLDPDELAQAFPRRRQVDLGEYAEALRSLQAGDAIAVQLNDLSSRALNRRFSLAAKQLGYRITWAHQIGDGELYLRVVQVPVDGTSWRGRRRSPCRSDPSHAAAWQHGVLRHPWGRGEPPATRPSCGCRRESELHLDVRQGLGGGKASANQGSRSGPQLLRRENRKRAELPGRTTQGALAKLENRTAISAEERLQAAFYMATMLMRVPKRSSKAHELIPVARRSCLPGERSKSREVVTSRRP
jgi:hypothetical protein